MEVREKKMMSMSQQIVELMETNQAQQDELHVLREVGQDATQMRDEFAKRIGMSEKKLQAIIKVRMDVSNAQFLLEYHLLDILGKGQLEEAANNIPE